MQQPVTFAAHARLIVKNAVRFDPAKHKGGMVYQALLHVGNSTVLNARSGGHLFFLSCEDVKGWGSPGDNEIDYDLIFQNGSKTELAKDLTVDQILHDSDTAVITAYFLLPRNEFEVLRGQITVTVNASKTKHSQFLLRGPRGCPRYMQQPMISEPRPNERSARKREVLGDHR